MPLNTQSVHQQLLVHRVHCDGFDILIEGSGTDSFTVFRDDAGEVTKVIYRARYPHDVSTNTVTGRSIVVRGEFNEFIERISGNG